VSTILPTLEDFGICAPVFIRKLDKRADWHPEVDDAARAQAIAQRIFANSDRGIFSLFRIASAEAFYSAITGLNALRTPQNNNTDFIWIRPEELADAGIPIAAAIEGNCRQSSVLHYDACVSAEAAVKLCQNLLVVGRQVHRCPKKTTQTILDQRRGIGCYALVTDSPHCQCEDIAE
jgi:hypothetical protein